MPEWAPEYAPVKMTTLLRAWIESDRTHTPAMVDSITSFGAEFLAHLGNLSLGGKEGRRISNDHEYKSVSRLRDRFLCQDISLTITPRSSLFLHSFVEEYLVDTHSLH